LLAIILDIVHIKILKITRNKFWFKTKQTNFAWKNKLPNI